MNKPKQTLSFTFIALAGILTLSSYGYANDSKTHFHIDCASYLMLTAHDNVSSKGLARVSNGNA